MDDRVDMRYVLERLDEIRTQTDLDQFREELEENLRVNQELRDNPQNCSDLPFETEPFETEPFETEPFEDFDVYAAIDEVKRDYIKRAMAQSKNVGEAAKLLGVKNYQTVNNWITKLGREL